MGDLPSKVPVPDGGRAAGLNLRNARNAGLPTDRLGIALFMSAATAAMLLQMPNAALANAASRTSRFGGIFNAIIRIVAGGVLLTGGLPGDKRGRQVDADPHPKGRHSIGEIISPMDSGRSFFAADARASGRASASMAGPGSRIWGNNADQDGQRPHPASRLPRVALLLWLGTARPFFPVRGTLSGPNPHAANLLANPFITSKDDAARITPFGLDRSGSAPGSDLRKQ